MPSASEWINGIEPSSISQHFLPAIHILASGESVSEEHNFFDLFSLFAPREFVIYFI